MLVDFKSRIDVDAEFQRGKVWSEPQQALLIDSILRGFDIPKIYVRKNEPDHDYLFDVVDGKQRLTAIWQFFADGFTLPRKADKFPGLGDLSGKRWSGLNDRAKDALQFANLTVSRIEAANEDEVRELFLRLQKGEPLNAAEKRNAMPGPVRDFVAETLAKHPFWSSTGLSTHRFGIDEHAAIVLALVREGGPTALKGADLHALYEDGDFDPSGAEARRTVKFLDQLSQIASCGEREIRTRWGLVDLAISLMRLKSDGRTASTETIMEFFLSFETLRRNAATALSDLQSELVEKTLYDTNGDESIQLPSIEPDFLAYHLAFAREGATEENVRTRSDIMYRRLVEHLRRDG